MARKDQAASMPVRPLLGGYQTDLPPSAMPPNQSPDLLNVLFDTRSARRREGMVPVNRFCARKNSLRNRGYTWRASALNNASTIDWKRVSGMLVAGHREALNAYDRVPDAAAPTEHITRLTVSLMCQPDPGGSYGYGAAGKGLVNWFGFNSYGTGAGNNPAQVHCRPILSKGPVQTMYHTGSSNPITPVKAAWGSGEQMPFSFMVYNGSQQVFEFVSLAVGQLFSPERKIRGRMSGATAIVLWSRWTSGGTGGVGTVWLRYLAGAFILGEEVEDAGTSTLIATVFTATRSINGPHWRCSFFAKATTANAGGRLVHLDAPIDSEFGPYPLHTYRLSMYANAQDPGMAGSSSNRVWFQVAEELGDGVVRSFTVGTPPAGSGWGGTATDDEVTAALATNRNPVQVFEMPAAACLTYGGNELHLNIDHNTQVLGFEGKVEDIQLWATDKSAGGTSFTFGTSMTRLDRRDSAALAEIMAYWGPDTVSERRGKPEVGLWEKDRAWFPEGTGKDIPLMPCPGVPTWNDSNGKGSLFFNGRTSYAFMPVASPNRQVAPGTLIYNRNVTNTGAPFGSWQDLLWDGALTYRHSVSFQVIPDSIEPGSRNDNTETGAYAQIGAGTDMPAQMICDWANVIRFGITTSGKLWAQAPGHAGAPAGGEHQTTEVRDDRIQVGTTVLIPGQRYVIKYVRIDEDSYELYLNGNNEITHNALTVPAGGRKTVGPLALGCFCSLAAVPDGIQNSVLRWSYNNGGVAKPQFNCTNFIGRIEDVRFGTEDRASGLPLDPAEQDLSPRITAVETDQGGLPTILTLRVNDRVPIIQSGAPDDAFFVAVSGLSIDARSSEHAVRLRRMMLAKTQTSQAVAVGPAAVRGFLTLTESLDTTANGGTTSALAAQCRFMHLLGHWDFAANVLGVGRQSRYYDNVEDHSTPADQQPPAQVYREFNVVPDRLGFVFPLELRCKADRGRGTYVIDTAGNRKDFTLGLWDQVSPQEERPRLAAGIALALANEVPITLIAQLKKTNGDRFLVTSAANTLYWLRTPWQQNQSPYLPTVDPEQRCLFMAGRFKDYIRHAPTRWDYAIESPGGSANGKSLTVECWIKPAEFARGVRRLLAQCWDGSSNALNWRVVLREDGAIAVEGAGWSVVTGPVTNFTSNVLGDHQWHHVACVLDQRTTAGSPTFDRVFVDGVSQPVWVSGARTTSVAGVGAGWIGGSEHGLMDPLGGSPGGTGTGGAGSVFVQPFFGHMRDFRTTRGARYSRNFTPPSKPMTVDSGTNTDMPASYQAWSTIDLFPLNEAGDAVASNLVNAGGYISQEAYARIDELVPISDGHILASNSSQAYPWDWRVFNDVLYLTNGLGPPLAVRHDGVLGRDTRDSGYYTDTFAPVARLWRGDSRPFGFAVGRYGVSPPLGDRIILGGAGAGGAMVAGVYTVAITHVSLDGQESDPVLVTAWAAIPANSSVMRLFGIPRSVEPHVARRRIYISSLNLAGALLFSREDSTDDNLSYGIESAEIPGAGRIYRPTRAVPLAGRFLEFHRQRGYVAAFPVDSNGANRSSFSEGLEPESHSRSLVAINVMRFDSGEGNPVTAIRQFVGRLFVGLRNATFIVTPGDTSVDFRQDQINPSVGPTSGHSVLAHDNRLYFRGEKSVYICDGASVQAVGDALNGIWSELDTTELAQLQSHAAYLPSADQYWLTVRRYGEQFGREILVMDLGNIGSEQPPAWSLLRTVPHSCLETVDDDLTDLPKLFLGTPHGQVFELLSGQIDGSRGLYDVTQVGSKYLIEGTCGAGGHTASSFRVAIGGFDVLGSGYRGLMCKITKADGSASTEGQIQYNNGQEVTFLDPLGFTPADGDTFVIGGYDAYWTSPWLPLDTASQSKKVRWVQLDFEPNTGSLDVAMDYAIGQVPVARAFRDLSLIHASTKATVDQAKGHHMGENLHLSGQGMYARLRFGTSGINKPFGVHGYELFFDSEGVTSGARGT